MTNNSLIKLEQKDYIFTISGMFLMKKDKPIIKKGGDIYIYKAIRTAICYKSKKTAFWELNVFSKYKLDKYAGKAFRVCNVNMQHNSFDGDNQYTIYINDMCEISLVGENKDEDESIIVPDLGW
jgi:hypothetical protein